MISTHRLLRRSFNNSWTIPCSRWLPFPVHRSRNYRVVVVTLGQSSTASDSRETFSRPATVALFPSLNGRNAEQRSHCGRLLANGADLSFAWISTDSSRIACTRTTATTTATIYLSYDPFFFLFPFHPLLSGNRSTTIVIQPCPISFTLVLLPVLLRIRSNFCIHFEVSSAWRARLSTRCPVTSRVSKLTRLIRSMSRIFNRINVNVRFDVIIYIIYTNCSRGDVYLSGRGKAFSFTNRQFLFVSFLLHFSSSSNIGHGSLVAI